ncbi:hypothetical protein EIP91_009163 [Steccherinum ochraceum]|uniref:Aminoglycoside phosphotransferase domain-containing protein n=1 Tax=Steccherinum ochraceum TaxID=92696 RepID=A0A4R0R1Z4_9APHY|nr:hypothetical protein EIP91_009163 [Steccherinum ochraceum]
MEFVDGTVLSDIWFDLEVHDIESVVRQLVELEARMMSASFPAGGSLYYSQDVEKLDGKLGIPLEDDWFCVGPDVGVRMWIGKRSQLDVDRGPYTSVESALVGPANKELEYLQRFGRPLLPFDRMKREHYQYQEQSPSNHIDNLHRYLRTAPSLVPQDPSLHQFRIRHPDLQSSNVIVSRTTSGDLQLLSLLDWQHASIRPTCLHAGIPQRLQNYADPLSHHMVPPSLPDDFHAMDDVAQSHAKELYRRRLVHYHYVRNTEACNPVHHAALADPAWTLRARLFAHAGDRWDGETTALKAALMDATTTWGTLSTDPCPLAFEEEDVRRTWELEAKLESSDETMEQCLAVMGCGSQGWVPNERYEVVKALCRKMKEDGLAGATEEERAEIEAHWIFDDMDERPYS